MSNKLYREHRQNYFRKNSFLLYLKVAIILSSLQFTACKCNNRGGKNPGIDSAAIRQAVPPSPVLSPAESISKMRLEDGFEIKLVAAEPLVVAPVALKFDDKGRMWVCEMQNYMPDTVGTGEEKPTGKIVILEDGDKDGVMDTRKVFMDGLVLPRALCLIENGILVAEPPNLWFVEIVNDKPGKKILVDSTYAAGGNPEHQANGLIRGLDNWIYSANCKTRYRKQGTKWLAERTHSRGQWGISQDDEGRLFYNNNSQNLLGDYFSPGFGAFNTNQKNIEGYEEKIVADNKVYPIRPTPGVNRGYMAGVLDDSLKLVNFTAASGPVLYRGDLFGKEYRLNAFVAEPSANLIKRNILDEKGFSVTGKQAYEGKEFLASVDERFRPVTLYDGPDGALYVVDMYRGIIQHKTYLTEYLKGEIKSRELTEPLNCGRIYKIVPKGKKVPANIMMPANPNSLAALLQHPNGWIRDKAKETIIDKRLGQVIPLLKQNLKQTGNRILINYSLWTLEGLGALQFADVEPLLRQDNWQIRAQGLSVLPSVINKNSYPQYLPVITQLVNSYDTLTAPYLAFLMETVKRVDSVTAINLLLKLAQKYAANAFIADAIISSIKGREEVFAKRVRSVVADTAMAINKELNRVINDMKNPKSGDIAALKKEYPKGVALFTSVCQTCHGADGNGIKSLAPPLNRSDWVVGNKNRLIAIVLYGLSGPVKVNEKVYKAPEIAGEMPGIGNNKDFTDEHIAELLSLIRSAWNNKADKVTPGEVGAVRKKFAGQQKAFTEEELKRLK